MRPASIVALYHAIGSPEETGYRDALPLPALERQLRWLKRSYAVRPLAELLEQRRAGRSLEGLAALTFDDNHRTVLQQALPLAESLGLPATWCLIAGPLEGRPFWRDQIRRLIAADRVASFLAFARGCDPAMARLRAERFYRDSKDPARVASPTLIPLLTQYLGDEGPPADFVPAAELRTLPAGVEIANHTLTHPVLAGLPAETQRAEIAGAAERLAVLGLSPTATLALPFGGPGSYDATTLAVAARAGISGLLLTADAPAAADDLSAHLPAVPDALPCLVRSLLGRIGDPAAAPSGRDARAVP